MNPEQNVGRLWRLIKWAEYRGLTLLAWRQEWGTGWSVATTRACEQSGGHHWNASAWDETMETYGRDCARCRCWESIPATTWPAKPAAVWVTPNNPNANDTGMTL